MAKRNEIADYAINAGIIVAVIVILYFVFKWIFAHGLFGKGGFGFHGDGGNDLFQQTGTEIEKEAKNIGQKLKQEYTKKVLEPGRVKRIGYELSIANKLAAKYLTKPGTNVVINKTLKAVNGLPNNEFMQAVSQWKKDDNWTDFYMTNLAQASILTGAHSDFLTKYGTLTGEAAMMHQGLDAASMLSGINLRNNGNH